eukprot:6437054-Prymnesium_polylepis.1
MQGSGGDRPGPRPPCPSVIPLQRSTTSPHSGHPHIYIGYGQKSRPGSRVAGGSRAGVPAPAWRSARRSDRRGRRVGSR